MSPRKKEHTCLVCDSEDRQVVATRHASLLFRYAVLALVVLVSGAATTEQDVELLLGFSLQVCLAGDVCPADDFDPALSSGLRGTRILACPFGVGRCSRSSRLRELAYF